MGCIPPVTVRLSLQEARARGVPFDDAWASAARDLPAGPATYRDPLDSTRPYWKAAYEHEPVRCGRAWSMLSASRR